ncbi:MAG: hypothetical protein ACREHC_01240, partial [Candidatus Levyibacteriota bacterium]
AGILRDTFVVRCLQRGEEIETVLVKIGLSEATGEEAKVKYLKLSGGGSVIVKCNAMDTFSD